jgi:glycine oxidase
MRVSGPHVVVVGDGVIGLAVTVNLITRGSRVTLIAPGFHGAASPASAGLLAPSVERTQGPGQAFADAARDSWASLAELARAHGAPPFEINRDGILRIARTRDECTAIQATLRDKDAWLSARDARARVPSLGDIAGGALLAGDGMVNVPAALTSLWTAIRAMDAVEIVPMSATAIEPQSDRPRVHIGDGRTIEADRVVLAAGAWTPTIHGLPRQLPIRPLRGIMVAVEGDAVPFPIYDAAGHVYVFPRHGRTIVGATSDDVGFDTTADESAAQKLVAAASEFLPVLTKRERHAPWAGLRPMTPDGLPIIGRDAAAPSVFFASGHGRNGFLEAALTGEVVASLVLGSVPTFDLSPFSPGRFDSA